MIAVAQQRRLEARACSTVVNSASKQFYDEVLQNKVATAEGERSRNDLS